MRPPFLAVDHLTMRFGGLTAVDGLTFTVEQGVIHGLIGPNGAGKTTTFNLISGYYRPTSGEIRLRGERVSGLRMHEVARRGVVRTFQHSTLFAELSVLENALVGTHMRFRPNIFAAIAGWDAEDRRGALARAEEVLDFFGLLPFAGSRAGDLAHGHQRALGMAVALAARPDIMLLDEPFTGMNPEETNRMMALMRKLRDAGVTILLVEHDMRAIMGLCDRITCMSFGRMLAEGSPAEIRGNPAVVEAYLGVPPMLLEIDGAAVSYGKVRAIHGVSLRVPEQGVVTVIGGNGAGKTTTLRAISGLTPLTAGEIRFGGERIDLLPPDRIVARGIAHVPEGRRIFPDLTVEENLRTGAFLRRDGKAIASDLEAVYDRFPRLRERRRQLAKTMSGGEQQMLAIGRALMARPKLLLMDEPTMGLAPVIVEEIAGIIRDIREQGVPVILVEQNAELALELADYAYVLETGRLTLEGPARDLCNNDHVRVAYLGL